MRGGSPFFLLRLARQKGKSLVQLPIAFYVCWRVARGIWPFV